MTTFYGRFYLIMKDKGLKITTFCKDLGFDKETVMSWKEQNPSIDDLRKISRYLGCSKDDLIGPVEIKEDFNSLSKNEKALIVKILSLDENQRKAMMILTDILKDTPKEKQGDISQYVQKSHRESQLQIFMNERGFSEDELFEILYKRKIMQKRERRVNL